MPYQFATMSLSIIQNVAPMLNLGVEVLKELEVLNPVCKGVGVAFKGILEIVDKIKTNKEEAEALTEELTTLILVLSALDKSKKFDAQSIIVFLTNDIKSIFDEIRKFLEEYHSSSYVGATINASDTQSKFKSYKKRLKNKTQHIMLSLQIDHKLMLESFDKKLENLNKIETTQIEESQTIHKVGSNQELNRFKRIVNQMILNNFQKEDSLKAHVTHLTNGIGIISEVDSERSYHTAESAELSPRNADLLQDEDLSQREESIDVELSKQIKSMGCLFLFGKDEFPQDNKKAFLHFKQEAKQGSDIAMYNLACMYFGLNKHDKALHWGEEAFKKTKNKTIKKDTEKLLNRMRLR